VPTMDSATWCRTPAAASAGRRLRPEVSKNFSTAASSNDGELARSITTCAPATASLRPSPVMLLTPLLGEAATTSWPSWRRMATVFEPIRPVPPITTIFMFICLQKRHSRIGAVIPQPPRPSGKRSLRQATHASRAAHWSHGLTLLLGRQADNGATEFLKYSTSAPALKVQLTKILYPFAARSDQYDNGVALFN